MTTENKNGPVSALSAPAGSADSIFERICGWRIPALRKMGLDMLATMTEAEAESELRKIGNIDCVLTDEPWGKGYPPNWHATLDRRRSRVVLTQGHGATRRGALIHALCDWRWRCKHADQGHNETSAGTEPAPTNIENEN